ncbi:PREDICTED: calcium-binding mitochondrial carrier protein SCaMC-3-like [Amphimedon queenslandica]|uniref:EF-hand domain-containing protein n=1 Tax=Amphimedon queenslandica TaxID=400682 RepID=A0AAN0J2M1_AMPQE|nr:PREDICTED: calcium-binding mitochondrial carrier protein SCaMC-3-like [Amphimedon queenslandica]|eukprot:XP_019850971.1 PREDICTED: calcium-binding mitochondrial carrier protein SCaMC-3-like [Amphimedon queenslandica]
MTEKGEEKPGLPQVPLTDKERIIALFRQLDVNDDGRIDVQEIRKRLRQQGMDPSVAETVVQIGDRNNDGRLDESEFLQYCTDQEKKLWTVFHYVDANKDGAIDSDEIKVKLSEINIRISDEDAKKLLRKMDKDGDVKITWEEWRDFLLLHPNTNWKEISKVWRHATFGNIGEYVDTPAIPDELSTEEKDSGIWWKQIIAGGGAGAVSRTVTAPLDRLKVFFQVQSMTGKSYTIRSCLGGMVSEGGVRSLWRGNGTNVIKIAPESALRFFAFEKIKALLKQDDQPLKVYERLLAGSTAGVIAQTTIYPMEVLKTRLALGTTGQYSGIINCFNKIRVTEGYRSFYRGLTPSLLGIIPYAGIDLAVYETLKNLWLKRHDESEPGVLIPLACGTVSSTCGQLVSYPLSLVRTRLQAQTSSPQGKETKGMIDTVYTITANEGVRGLYRGILPNFLKVIPAVSIGYVVYEKFKVLLKVSTVK